MTTTEDLQHIHDTTLRAWDWRAELRKQERAVLWLARKTGHNYQAVYRISRGEQEAPLEWLRKVARVLGRLDLT